MVALKSNKKLTTVHRMMWYRDYFRLGGVHAFDGGLIRIMSRRDRRPTLPRERRRTFYPKYGAYLARTILGMLWTHARLRLILHRVWNDPDRRKSVDGAIAAGQTTMERRAG